MRTTVRLNKPLLERARKEAARRGITLTALIEQGLRLGLTRPPNRPSIQQTQGVILKNTAKKTNVILASGLASAIVAVQPQLSMNTR
jgi:hypothetical protein